MNLDFCTSEENLRTILKNGLMLVPLPFMLDCLKVRTAKCVSMLHGYWIEHCHHPSDRLNPSETDIESATKPVNRVQAWIDANS